MARGWWRWATIVLPDGRPIAVTGSHDNTARVWDLSTGTPIGAPLTCHKDWVKAVAALVFQGRSTRQIARALSISPYTVQEHLTAVFDKVGVRSRGELVGQVFFRHCLPTIPD